MKEKMRHCERKKRCLSKHTFSSSNVDSDRRNFWRKKFRWSDEIAPITKTK